MNEYYHKTKLNLQRRNPIAGEIEDAKIEKSIIVRINDSVQVSKQVGVQAYNYVVRPTLVITGTIVVGAVVVVAVIVSSICREVASTVMTRSKYKNKLSDHQECKKSPGNIIFNGPVTFNGSVTFKN